VVDLKSCTSEQDRLRKSIFDIESPATKKRKRTDKDVFFGVGNSSDTDDDNAEEEEEIHIDMKAVKINVPPGLPKIEMTKLKDHIIY
jgi:hypothetical protein